jgi:hypothetical protein
MLYVVLLASGYSNLDIQSRFIESLLYCESMIVLRNSTVSRKGLSVESGFKVLGRKNFLNLLRFLFGGLQIKMMNSRLAREKQI